MKYGTVLFPLVILLLHCQKAHLAGAEEDSRNSMIDKPKLVESLVVFFNSHQ
jgi:hypothetical protein